jgi:hypothetical protein
VVIDDGTPPPTPEEFEAAAACLTRWAEDQQSNPVVAAVERDGARWFVRLNGTEKSVFSVWFELGQRTLHVETYVMPAPEQQRERLFEYLLRKNNRLFGLTFTIGEEAAVYLAGRIHLRDITEAELDRLLGTAYVVTEECFRPLMRIGFGDKFNG